MHFPHFTVEHLHLHFATLEESVAKPSVASASATKPVGSPIRFELSGLEAGGMLVTDHSTGLMWLRDESAERMDFAAAEKHCAALRVGGFDDWRLPELDELESIRDITRHEPCLDSAVFKSNSSWVWTRTPPAWSPDCAWIVHFSYGNVNNDHRHHYAFVRAVRRVSPAGQ